ncbi:MAG: amidohydrolase [Ruminococcus sp.]|nr:amidohydrolase [Ruminococcus sp.]
MIIDFHTHTFPDAIAARTIAYLTEKGGIKPYRAGTLSSLIENMRQCGIDCSVVLPVATLPKQVDTINRVSAENNGKNHVFFAGGIHPDCENVGATLDFIKQSGLFGVKLHPDYQGVHFDDPRYLNIMYEAAQRGLYIVTHAGYDVAFRDHVHCTPDMVLHALKELKGVIEDKLILAHLGGYDMPDEVLDKLIGAPVYMDTAAVLRLYPDKCKEIILRHGVDKILFASDSPWDSQRDYVTILKSFALGDEAEEKIFCENALRILSKEKTDILP